MCSKAVLDEITERICAAAKEVLGEKLEKVLLYGSYARGDYDEYSDIDIFVLADIPHFRICSRALLSFLLSIKQYLFFRYICKKFQT